MGPFRSLIRWRLNRAALRDITASRGERFSIGASLLSRPGFMFAGSSGMGIQRLLVRTACNIRGTRRADRMAGGGGNDFLCGFAGGDRISGGLGFDVVGAGLGHDSVTGGPGRDTINLGSGDDVARGGGGGDKLNGGRGHDLLFGGKGNDTLRGRGGADLIVGGAGHDTCYTKPGDVVRGCEDIR
jgi:Ca2+-binding RTX toxin-like protein